MKLYRSQLDQLISKQLFEISTEDLKLDNHQFINNEIFCTITVDSASNGYRIYGDLKGKVLESCDRCLVSYENEKIIFYHFRRRVYKQPRTISRYRVKNPILRCCLLWLPICSATDS